MTDVVNGTHIKFSNLGRLPSGKTSLWSVESNDGAELGVVKWFGRWRKYCFFPAADTVFEGTCMREITQFIEDRTKEHRSQ